MNEIVKTPMPMVYADLERLAASVAQSGLFGIKTKDQAIALMMIAHAEGRHPALAARDYDVIQGRPAKKAEAMMRDFIEAGGKVEWHALTDTVADATFTHPQTGSVRIDWDMKRATVAGFAGKDMWKKFPRAMLRSRVVSEGVRTVWPLATSGMYVPEEAADIDRKLDDVEDDAPPPTPIRAAAATMPRPAMKAGPVVYPPQTPPSYGTHPLDETDGTRWLRALETMLVNAASLDEVAEIGGHATVGTAINTAPDHVKRRINELLANHYARFAETAETPATGMAEAAESA